MLIQLIEDDARLAAVIAESFQTRGARVETFCKGGTALAAQRDHLYDVVLLDLGLPDQDGLEVLRTMRAARNSVPVLVLTSHGDVADRIEGLDAGADDYLTKPFDLGELAARVNALLRRAREFTEDLLTAGDLTFDSINRDTRVGDVPIDLTEREAALLELLLRRNGKVLRKQQVAREIYPDSGEQAGNSVEVLVHRLRTKLKAYPTGIAIRTVRKIGYRLSTTGEKK
jgi:two-component system response regulator QseB/two-component system response regulator TctD